MLPHVWPRYTLGHVRNNLGMDDASEQDIAGLPPECFENGEYIGYPTTKAEFAIQEDILPGWLAIFSGLIP
jgi:hypothetical protein